jgi:hypothetical protein
MSDTSPGQRSMTTWEDEIRAREEEARVAFLTGNQQALAGLWSDGYAVNSPLQRVIGKEQLLDLLRSGRIRHLEYEAEIEYMSRHGDVVVVMGNDRVVNPPEGAVLRRRYTNIWCLDGGAWRSIARHAHAVSDGVAV